MNNLHLKILSPEKTFFEGDVSVVQLPGTEGSVSFLAKHAPFVSSLSKGIIMYRKDKGKETSISIESGFVEVSNNIVTVCIEGIVSYE